MDGGRWKWGERGRFVGREGDNYGQRVGGGARGGFGEVDWVDVYRRRNGVFVNVGRKFVSR